MEKVLLRFGHIGKQIFEQLDNVTTTNCRMVTISWQTFMDNERVSSFQMIKFMTNVADAYLRKFLMKRDPEHCMELAKCVYFIYDNYPADWKFPSYQSNPSKQLYIMVKLGWIDHPIMIRNPNNFKFWDKKCHPKDHKGVTLLHCAATNGNLQVYKLIIGNALDKNPKDITKFTPLHLAAGLGYFEICQLIIENIHDKNPKDKFGKTPFHQAAHCGHLKICQLIIENVQDKNPADYDKRTPLHFAAEKGHPSKPTRRQRPKAVGGASERSERGRSALFKNPLFFAHPLDEVV